MILTLSKSGWRAFNTKLNSSGMTAERTFSNNDFCDRYQVDPKLWHGSLIDDRFHSFGRSCRLTC